MPSPPQPGDRCTLTSMILLTQPIQLQRVGARWEQVIPVLALLLISLFSVGLTVVFRYKERLYLEVKRVISCLSAVTRVTTA